MQLGAGSQVEVGDLPDCQDNPETIVGHYVEGLATRLWREVLLDLDAGMIRWFELRGSQVSEVTFAVIPDSRGGFFGMPAWRSQEVALGE
jgi:hypothetical protein